jgi:toxin CcdB
LPQQFDLVENLNPARRRQYPFLVVLQHDRVSSIDTVVAAPLSEVSSEKVDAQLHPMLNIEGRRYVVFVQQLAAVPRQSLGRMVGSAESHRYAIVRALDLLFTGI